MRVLHVIPLLDARKGGPPVIISRLAAAQAAQGLPVALAAYTAGSEENSLVHQFQSIPGGTQVELILLGPFRDGLEPYTARRAARLLRRVMPRFDLVHLNGVWDPLILASARAARRAGKPYVVTPHGMLDPWSLSQRRFKKKLALALGVKGVLNRALFLHLGNRDEQALIAPLGIRSKGEIIPNGIFIEEFNDLPPAGSFYAAHPELGGQPYVLFLSRLHFKKGLDYLADAFALLLERLPRTRLVVAGDDGGFRATFQRMINEHNIGGRVHMVGALYGRDKLAAAVDARCFCLPSRQEGFSIAITEALGCGLPVVVTEGCHFPEVEEAGAGRVVPADAAAIAAALEQVVSDPGARGRMGAAGRRLVESRFTWHKVAEASIAAYRRHGIA